MVLNFILLFVGVVFLIYGIKIKAKFFLIAGAVLIGLGLIASGVDYIMGGVGAVDNHRLPYLIDSMMK